MNKNPGKYHVNIDNKLSETHCLQLHPQLVVGEFEGSGDGLKVVDQHAAKATSPTCFSPLSLQGIVGNFDYGRE